MTADQLWRDACRRNHETPFPIGARYADLLVVLLRKGPDHGSALMRAIGDTHQPNTVRRLQRLDALGFVASTAVVIKVPRGGSTTKSKAVEWRLTKRGRELAWALFAQWRDATSAYKPGCQYWLTALGEAVVGAPTPAAVTRAAPGARSAYWPTGRAA